MCLCPHIQVSRYRPNQKQSLTPEGVLSSRWCDVRRSSGPPSVHPSERIEGDDRKIFLSPSWKEPRCSSWLGIVPSMIPAEERDTHSGKKESHPRRSGPSPTHRFTASTVHMNYHSVPNTILRWPSLILLHPSETAPCFQTVD